MTLTFFGNLIDQKMMDLAIEQAKRAAREGEVPVGAVLVDASGEILAADHNRPISRKDPTAHAEILVLRAGAEMKGNYRLTGTSLYVTIEPCPMCVGAMVAARVSRLVYGARDPKSGAAGSVVDLCGHPGLNHRIEVDGPVREAECGGLLRSFFRGRRV